MAQFFIRRPIVAMVIAIVTVILGLVTLSRLPIAEYPQVSPTLIEVTANYRGAAAEAVMDSVATPIESKVNGVDKMLYMQSFSANDGKMVLKERTNAGKRYRRRTRPDRPGKTIQRACLGSPNQCQAV